MASPAKRVLALVGACKAHDAAMNFTKRGLDLNSSLEQSRVGIATLITSMAKLEDARGRGKVRARQSYFRRRQEHPVSAPVRKSGGR